MKRYCFILLTFAVGVGISAAGIITPGSNEPVVALRGVETVYVDVRNFFGDIRAEVDEGGLSEEQLIYVVLKKLKTAGIKAVSSDEAPKSAQHDLLYLKLYILSPELKQVTIRTLDGERVPKSKIQDRYIYAAVIEFRQEVILKRDFNITLSAPTWSTEHVGFRRLREIRTDISDMVDSFIQVYNTANASHK